jgi:hypothetical protein
MFALVLFVALVAIVAPVAACSHDRDCCGGQVCEDHQCVYSCGLDHDIGTCPDGLGCVMIGQEWGSCHTCPHHHELVCEQTCNHDHCYSNGNACTHNCQGQAHRGDCLDWDYDTVYDCHTGDPNYQACDNHAPGPGEQYHYDKYGCRECPSGEHKEGNVCVPDVCGEDFCTDENQYCDGQECVTCPEHSTVQGDEISSCVCDNGYRMVDDECIHNGGLTPFTRGLEKYALGCDAALAKAIPTFELRLPPGGISLIVKATRPAGGFDGLVVWDPTGGEQSFNPACTGMEWWNDRCAEFRAYGANPQVTLVYPHGKIRVLVATEESSTSGVPKGIAVPPYTVTISDTNGKVYFSETTDKDIFDKTFVVVDDTTGCIIKPQLIGVWGDWIPLLPGNIPEN